MTKAEWKTILHFTSYEFDSPDQPGSGLLMHFKFIKALDLLRSDLNFPLIITSGYRTPVHNKEVGGVFSSAHTRGWAADIAIRTSSQRFALLSKIFSGAHPFTRIGIADSFIHLDMDPMLPPNCIWTY